jgi:hypothetical protein
MCFEHESLNAMIDVCPPENSEGLFDASSDAWGIAKLYTSHDELEGVQFREQKQVADAQDVASVVRALADLFYSDFGGDSTRSRRPEPSPGIVLPDDWEEEAVHKTLDEF